MDSWKHFLGNWDCGDHTVFQKIPEIPAMRMASCGHCHTLALDETDDVWVWGCGEDGQLGTGNTISYRHPICVSSLRGTSAVLAGRVHSLAIQPDGSVLTFGDNLWGQLGHNQKNWQVPTLSPFLSAIPNTADSTVVPRAMWETVKQACDKHESLGNAEPLPSISTDELIQYREEFEAGLISGAMPVVDWNGLH